MLTQHETEQLVAEEEIKRIRFSIMRGEAETPAKGHNPFMAWALANYIHKLEKRIEALESHGNKI